MEWCPEWRDQQQPDHPALPLFAPDDEPSTKKPRSTTSTSRMGSLFSLAQWQELELQALIYKYIMSGASVPLDLILPLKRSLVCSSSSSSSPYYYHSIIQAGYWGRCVVDPEPWRCRRTDGKKWRCAREVVAAQKYCERHVHRGRNRSRKHVEIIPTVPTTTTTTTPPPALLANLHEKNDTRFTLSGPSPTERRLDGEISDGCLARRYCPKFCCTQQLQGERADSRVLMRFFDVWPVGSEQGRTASNNNAGSVAASASHMSISIPDNSPSDFSLKLSTGNTDDPGLSSERGRGDGQVQAVVGSWSGWENHGEASMGGPLAEALRSSTFTASPTSILQKPNGSVSENSSAST